MVRRAITNPFLLKLFHLKMLIATPLRGRPFRRRTARVCRARSICVPAAPPLPLAAAARSSLLWASSVEESEEPPPPLRRPPAV